MDSPNLLSNLLKYLIHEATQLNSKKSINKIKEVVNILKFII